MIPFAATLCIQNKATWQGMQKGRSYWIPLFLIWLLLMPIVLVMFPVVFVAGLVVRVSAFRLYWVVWKILSSMRNTLVEVENPEMQFRLCIR